MSLSSLFNLPSAPSQLLKDNATGAQNSPSAGGNSLNSGGDAFASYMSQQMSSGQFANWQNLTSALASQNSLSHQQTGGLGAQPSGLGAQPSGFGAQPSGFGSLQNGFSAAHTNWGSGGSNHAISKPNSTASSSASNTTSSANSGGSNQTQESSNSTGKTGTNPTISSASGHKNYANLTKYDSLLGDSIESGSGDLADSSGGTPPTSGNATAALYSTNAWLMSNGSQTNASAPGVSAEVANSDLKSKLQISSDSQSGLPSGLPIVLPSIGAALLAQQQALSTKDGGPGSANALNGKLGAQSLTTVSLSSNIQLITPAQTDTNPQSLITYARGMGLNDSQIHQLFGPEAAHPGALSAHAPSTESLMSSGTALPSASISAGASAPVSTTLDSNANALGTFSTTAQLSPTANAVLSQINNFQVQIQQAPGAIGIQSEATASTLAEISGKLAPGATFAGSGDTPVSTLEALSVMEASLRPEDIEALQAHFANSTKGSNLLSSEGSGATGSQSSITLDMNTALNTLNVDGSGSNMGGSSGDSNSGSGSGSDNSQQNNSNLPSDMAAAYEKLSNKFATEVSNRLQQQFAQGQWKMKFALRPSSLGMVDVQLEMKDGKLAANFQSNNPLTQNLIHTNSHQLRHALQGSGIQQSSVQVGSGQTGGQGSSSGQNSGVPYTHENFPVSGAQGTEEIAAADESKPVTSSNSDSQLDILA